MRVVNNEPPSQRDYETVYVAPLYSVKDGALIGYVERVKLLVPVYPKESEPK